MRAICLIDTSVFVEFLHVPNKSSQPREIVAAMREKVSDGEGLFLPMATIVETGNHIGQNGSGDQRRQCAERFVDQVRRAIAGESPFTPINFLESAEMQEWLDEFPDWATRGYGLGDLSIVHDWQRQRDKNQGRRVYIWSLDDHLSGYDTGGA